MWYLIAWSTNRLVIHFCNFTSFIAAKNYENLNNFRAHLFIILLNTLMFKENLTKRITNTWNEVFFVYFRGTFHNMFKTRHTCTYSCIGTSGKKIVQNPHEKVLAKKTLQKTLVLGFMPKVLSGKILVATFFGKNFCVFLVA